MTWQLGAFAILALALAAGFAWYERTRPDARIVALVGTLAAFAALGRIAFAAVPNVKPTTDIVLISGYALGGAPGFVVGALAGLTSNFFFGQGPWTPWQMAAWGMTGVLGAGVAVADGARRIGRWPLALVCGLAGFAFTAVQDVGDWVTYSDHSRAQLGALRRQGHRLRRGARARLRGVRARVRAGADQVDPALRAPVAGDVAAGAGRRAVWSSLVLGAARGSMSAAAGGRAPPARRGDAGELSRRRPEQRRRSGRGRGAASSLGAVLRLGRARRLPRQGQQPAGRPTRRPEPDRATSAPVSSTASDVGSLERTILVVRAAGLSADGVRRARPGRGVAASHVRRDGSVGGLRSTSPRSRSSRCARRAIASRPRRAPGCCASRTPTAASTSPPPAASSDVDDTGAALEALAVAGAAPARTLHPRGRVHPRPAEPRRRLPVPARRRLKRPVDRLGGPGSDRGRRQLRARSIGGARRRRWRTCAR